MLKRMLANRVSILIAWEPIEINVGSGSEGFSIENGNFVWSEANGFGGWLGKCNERMNNSGAFGKERASLN
jgi:hypothetical protein